MKYKDQINATAPDTCQWQGCSDEARHPAPMRIEGEKGYYWFCLMHIREYNASWDFFTNHTVDEIENFRIESTTGHRPTWNMGVHRHMNEQTLADATHAYYYGDEKHTSPQETPALPAHIISALKTLHLTPPTTKHQIKKQYKQLVKRYHPDLHPDDPHAEDMFKSVSDAYRTVMHCSFIPDI